MKTYIALILALLMGISPAFAAGGKNQGETGQGETSTGSDSQGEAEQDRTGR